MIKAQLARAEIVAEARTDAARLGEVQPEAEQLRRGGVGDGTDEIAQLPDAAGEQDQGQ